MNGPAIIARGVSFLVIAAWPLAGLAQGDVDHPNPVVPATTAVSGLSSPLPRHSSSDLPLSRSTTDVVRLIQSGVDESVLLSFIENCGRFNLCATHLIYLNDFGASAKVISAMLAHDRQVVLREQLFSATNSFVSPSGDRIAAAGDVSPNLPAPVLAVPVVALSSTGSTSSGTSQSMAQSIPILNDLQGARFPDMAGSKPASEPATNAERSTQPPIRRRIQYPVREPYAVQLTDPIVIFEPPSF
jgi:hypothetical protein